MKVLEVAQKSQEWIEARAGLPTASEWDALITPSGEPRKGQMPQTYLARKLAEKWGGPLPGFGSWAMDQGSTLEDHALPWYELTFGEDVQRVGLCTDDAGLIGCSPDGLIGENGGIEIKCPESPTHVKYLLSSQLPHEYTAQVQGSLLVTGRQWWKFVSYRRHFPQMVLTIEPDAEFQKTLAAVLFDFCNRLDAGYKRLLEMNGGPPPKREPMIFSHDYREPEPGDDVIP